MHRCKFGQIWISWQLNSLRQGMTKTAHISFGYLWGSLRALPLCRSTWRWACTCRHPWTRQCTRLHHQSWYDAPTYLQHGGKTKSHIDLHKCAACSSRKHSVIKEYDWATACVKMFNIGKFYHFQPQWNMELNSDPHKICYWKWSKYKHDNVQSRF